MSKVIAAQEVAAMTAVAAITHGSQCSHRLGRCCGMASGAGSAGVLGGGVGGVAGC
jgi:hypothetical protein